MSSFDEIRSGLLKKYNVSAAGASGSTNQQSVGSQGTQTQTNTSDFYTIRSNLLDKYSEEKTAERQNAVYDWATRFNNAMQGISNSSSKSGRWYTRSAIDSFGSDIDALIRDYDSIKDYANRLGLPNAQRYLKQLQDVQSQIQREKGWYQKYRGSGHNEVETALSSMDAGDERSWLEDNRYEVYKTASDYSQRVQYGMEAFESSKPKDKEEESWFDALGRYLGKVSDTTMAMGDTGRMVNEYRKDTTYKEPAENWTQDQRDMYGYLYSINPEAASDYAVKTSENYRQAENEQKLAAIQEWATKNGKNATAGTVAAIAAMPLSLADTLNALTEYNARGTISTPSAPTPGQVSEAITGAVGQNLNEKYGTISEKIPVIGGKGWGDAYQLGTSIANSLLSAYTQGSVGTDVLFFGSAASSTMYSAKDRGATDEQAIKLGTLSGLAEAAGEHFSIENLISMSDAQTMKAFFGNVLKQSGIEASEEGFTTLMNNFAEQLIMGEDSTFYEKMRAYMSENGMSEQEAKKQAWKDMAEDLAFDMVGGAISGGVSTGIQTGAQKIFSGTQQAQTHNEPLTDDKESLTTELASSEESSAVDDKMSAVGVSAENATTNVGVSEMETVQMTEDIDSFAKQFGTQANRVKQNYIEGQNVQEYEVGFQSAYALGLNGKSKDSLNNMELAGLKYLSESQRENAYLLGRDAAAAKVAEQKKAPVTTAKLITEDGTVGDAVNIAEIVSMDDNNMTFKLDDGRNVTDDDLSFEKGQQVLSTVWDLGMDMKNVNTILAESTSNTASDAAQAAGIQEAYHYGSQGYSMDQLTQHGADAAALTENQRKAAWQAGWDIHLQKAEAAPGGGAKVSVKTAGVWFDAGGGNVRAFDSADTSGLSKAAVAGAQAAQVLQKLGIGKSYYFYESYVNDKGERVHKDQNGIERSAPNGWYDKSDGSIHIDLNAGSDGNGLTLYTLSHELTHFVEQWSPKKYQALADFLVDNYGKGASVDELVTAKQAELSESRGTEVSYDEAYSEFIADSMEAMLADGNVLEKLTELKKTDRSLFDKIREFFDDLVKKIREIYKELKPDSAEGKAVLEMKDQIEQIQQLFAEALADAGENFQAVSEVGLEVDMNTESVAPAILYSERTWRESDYVQEREKAAEEIHNAIGVSVAKAEDYIDSVNSIAKMIAEDRTRLDYFSSPGRSSFIGNVEYGGSFDFSTLCKKRRLLTGTFTAIQEALPNTALTADEILDIRNRMKKAGLEVSCGLCYVEGSRANMGQFSKEFLRLYKQYYPDAWQPNMADVNTPDGIEWVRINHPECYEQYEYFWNHYGTLKEGDKNLFASQQKPKLYQLHTEYKGEILQKFKDDENVEEKNLNGGIRLQSFSDFEIVHLIDTMQIIMDMSRVGLSGQAYTKVPDFAWALGDTGLKINLSLIAKGVDADGKLIFDDVEGMPITEAMRLRDRYSKNVGTILVAFNDEQLMAAMADDRVDFIIPFHRSQWKKSQYEAMGLPAKTKDYTYMQNEKFIKPQYHEYRGRMVKDKATNYMPNEYWDFSKSGKENAAAYLEMCARNNKRPKFYKLLQNNGDGSYSLKADGSTDGYWKLLIDFKMYDNDGIGSPQTSVTPGFNMEEATRMLTDYKGGHSSFPVAQGVVDDFVKEYKQNHDGRQFSDRKKADTPQQTEQKALLEDKYYARQIDKWDGKDHGGSFRVGKVSEPLLKVGIPDADIWFDQSKAAKQLDGKEEVTKDVLKKIPYLLEHPIAISESYDNTVMVFGEMYDENGNPIVVALRVNSTNRRNHITLVNKIRSVGTRTHNLDKLLSDDAILYLNETKKETNHWFNALGRSTPFGGTKFGLIRSISFDVAKSNIIGTDPENNSAIQNQDRSAGTSNRALLANAFEGLAQTPAEEQKIQEYRDNVDLLNEQEKKLQELRAQIRDISFGKGERDTKKLQQLQEEATKTANRIDIYDKRLLKLEAAKPLQDVLHREREKVRRETNQKNQETMKRFREEAKAAYEGKQSDAEIMEKEFIRLMKAYEKHSAASGARIKSTTEKIQSQQEEIAAYKADMAVMEKEFMRAMKAYELQEKKNNAEWEKEFKRLLLEYDSAERNISRLEQKLENQRASAKNSILRRKESAQKRGARRKIRKSIMELDKLLNRGDKKKNVKDGMSQMVTKSLKLAEALFMDEYSNRDMLRNGVGIQMTDAEESAFREAYDLLQRIESGSALAEKEFSSEIEAQEYLRKLDSQLSGKMAKLKDVFARERKRLYGTTVSDLLGQLADEYNRLSEAEDGAVRAAKDENVYAHLLQLQKDVGGTTVRDMSLSQMEMVADAYTMVLTTVRNANKMFAKNLKFKRDTLAGMAMSEIGAAAKKISKLVSPGKDAADKFSWNNMKPVYAFERLGSETLKTLFGNIRKGQDVWAVDMQEADAFRREQYRKHGWKKWDVEKLHRFEFESGKVELNLGQIMSLYAYSRREAALDHLLKGGFVFSGSTEVVEKKNGIKRRYLKKDATAYNLSADELMQVIGTLSAEQKAFVEDMQTYLSDTMGGKGNEVSLQMYGIKSFGEKNYFPLRSAGQYMEKAKEDSFRKEQGQISIVNSGFTKATTPHASNPITLDGFMDVWAEHVNDMSMYHSFALPMEDFRRVYNYSTPNVEEGNSQSVNAAIENAYGKAATDYIDQLYKDLNGGAVSDNRENLSKKLVGLHKKAAVFSSASVVIQQPSAFVRAFALVDPKYFIGPKVDSKRHKQLWAELKQYAPVAFVKEMGYFDTGMGRSAKDYLQAEEYSGIKEKMTALFKDSDYRDEILGKAPSLADEMTWCVIWEAVKRETKAKNYGISPKSAEFLRIAGDRFSEVIDKTQVYDSVLSRSANMRSKSGLMNMVTSFMAEPTTSINMLEDALRKGDRRQLKRTVGAVYGSVLLNALLVSVVYAARDDDEDETYWEKYLSSVAVEMVDGLNPITYYPFLRDVWSIFQGYDVERSDMSLITDFANAAKNVISAGQKVQNASEDEEASAIEKFKDALWGMVDSVANLTGLPVKNIRRDIEGARNMYKTISTDLAGRKTTALSLQDAVLADVMNSIPIGNLLYSKSKRDQLYGAITAGDSAYVQRLRSGYDSDNSYHSAIRQALREHDSRIWEAAIAWNNNDLDSYMRIAKEIRGENQFDQDDIVLAIRAEASAMEESSSSASSKVNGYFTNEKFGVAMGQNNTSMADTIRKDLIDTAMSNGKTREEAEESVRSTARTQLKQLYADGTITGANAEKMLVKYGGQTREDAADKVAEWKYEKDYPELDGRITYSQYKRWEADGKSRGIDLDTFTDVAEYRGGNTSAGVRSQDDVAAYINGLPISTAQKDALWCCFWSESTLYKNAPWH